MPILPASANSIKIPTMIPVRQHFDPIRVEDVVAATRHTLSQGFVHEKVVPGAKVAVCVGSRGITNIATISKAVIDYLRELGADVSVVPAMGSHGGGSVAGMLEMLEGYGVTEQTMGVPIVCTNDVTEIGKTPDGVPVLIASDALAFDVIVPVCRVKPHTDFRGPIESGLCKMLTIGLGRHEGCSRLHKEGFGVFKTLIPQAAQVVLDKLPVGFGVAIVENAYDETFMIEAVDAPDFIEREKELLVIAKDKMPRLMFKDVDVLIVEQIGKNISGAGMDPNIMGRIPGSRVEEYRGPAIKRIVVLGLTPETHGNAIGIGAADFTTKALVDAMDPEPTYANAIASGNAANANIPPVWPTADEAIIAGIWMTGGDDMDGVKIVRIKDTLHLADIWVSESMKAEVEANPNIELL